MHSAHLLLAVLGGALLVQGGKLPTWITTCYRDDPNLNACAEKNAQAAIPFIVRGDRKFRVPVLDPLQVTEITLDKDATKLGLDITMRNLSVSGFAQSHISNFSIDFENRRIEFINILPRFGFLGTYEASGQILILPFTGNGPLNITLVDIWYLSTADYEIEKRKNGNDYMAIKTVKFDLNVTKAYLQFDNLFNGDKLLGENINMFVNENWKEIVKEFSPVLAQAIGDVIKQVFNNLVQNIPFDDLFPLKP